MCSVVSQLGSDAKKISLSISLKFSLLVPANWHSGLIQVVKWQSCRELFGKNNVNTVWQMENINEWICIHSLIET